jgi:hypothetical protein
MGMGDEIIASGEARRLYDSTGKKVLICGKTGSGRWSPLWEGSPIILKPSPSGQELKTPHVKMINCGGRRFYLDYDRMKADLAKVRPSAPFSTRYRDGRLPYRFNNHKSARGELWFVKKKEPKYIIIEPNFKRGQFNRDWGFNRWCKVAQMLRAYPLLQIGPVGKPRLPGVKHIPANSFVDACHLMGEAIMYVGPEGGLYHAAGALHVPSVAIFGGFVSPDNQGYPESVNFYDPKGSPCGQRVQCKHCRDILRALQPKTVATAVKEMFYDRVQSLQLNIPGAYP